jgi:hypothetical protein
MFEGKAFGATAVAVLILLIVGLCACGEGDEKPTASPTPATPAVGEVPGTVPSPTGTGTPTASSTPVEPTPWSEVPTVTTLALDMDPHGDTANDDRTVGPIESCISVAAGDTFDIDVVLDAIPSTVAGGNLAGFQYFLGFDVSVLTFIGQSHTVAGINLIARAPNSCSEPLGCLDRAESVPEPPDSGSPPSPAVHDVLVADPSGPEGPEPADPAPYAGGVLGRYTIQANSGATPGVYGIGLSSSMTYVAKLSDRGAATIWDLPGNGIDDDGDGAVDEDILLDATAGYGQVAIGAPCPEGPG